MLGVTLIWVGQGHFYGILIFLTRRSPQHSDQCISNFRTSGQSFEQKLSYL